MDYVKEWNKFVNQFSTACCSKEIWELRKRLEFESHTLVRQTGQRKEPTFIVSDVSIGQFIQNAIKIAFPSKYNHLFVNNSIYARLSSEWYSQLIVLLYLHFVNKAVAENSGTTKAQIFNMASKVFVRHTVLGANIKDSWFWFDRLKDGDKKDIYPIFQSLDSSDELELSSAVIDFYHKAFEVHIDPAWAMTHTFKTSIWKKVVDIPIEFMFMANVFRQYFHDTIIKRCLEKGACVGSELYEGKCTFKLKIEDHPCCLKFARVE